MSTGSLCSGYGGLELAHGQPLLWHAEYDRHAATIHDTHWPDVPNLGDITTVDWSNVEPVELLTAGYPCQPFSYAGKREGTNDERHLWPHVAEAVRVLRPRLVLLENVAGHRSMGFGTVLGDLAQIGYDARWCSVRASDIGAPHRRERVFILATDTRSERAGWVGGAVPGTVQGWAGFDVHATGYASGRLDWWYATPERAKYAAAVERWEQLTRPAPTLHDDRGRLNPRFSEWMMGLPDGWVTDCDIPVTAQHKAIGNGVCPQQAALALAVLTDQPTRIPYDVPCLLPTPIGRDGKGVTQDSTDLSRLPNLSLSLLPTPMAHTGRRPADSIGDAGRWTDPKRSRELQNLAAYLNQ